MIKRSSQKGSALIYILIAIALLAALTATFVGSSSKQTSSQNATKSVTELGSQINFIRGAIDECVMTYPGGDTAMAVPPALIGGQTVERVYPLEPNNTYLLNPTSNYAEHIRCPGNPGSSNNHAKIFGASTGKPFPPAPNLFTKWVYHNDVDGIYLTTNTTSTDAYLKTALTKLNEQFSRCEAEYVDASGGAKIWTSTGGTCPISTLCFRVWIKTTGTSLYPDDAAACP